MTPAVAGRLPARASGPQGGRDSPVRRACPHVFLVTSLACQASCAYCFGPNRGAIMNPETGARASRLVRRLADESGARRIEVTLHGGEPLLAGYEVVAGIIDRLEKDLGAARLQLSLQTNGWLLDDRFVSLFSDHQVRVGVSLDGPEDITDRQRGEGYFRRTMDGARLLRRAGMPVGVIATVTEWSAPRVDEIVEFFAREGLAFGLHPAWNATDTWLRHAGIRPATFGRILESLISGYTTEGGACRCSTIESYLQAMVRGHPNSCHHGDCSGSYLAVSPTGDLYPCQRFCGRREMACGHLDDEPGLDTILSSSVVRALRARNLGTDAGCRDCEFRSLCRGGCPHQAWAGTGDLGARDPFCPSYEAGFRAAALRLGRALGEPENLSALASEDSAGAPHPLLRAGDLHEITLAPEHPFARRKRLLSLLAAHELGRSRSADEAAQALLARGRVGSADAAAEAIGGVRAALRRGPPRPGILYLNMSATCDRGCRHCFAAGRRGSVEPPFFPVERVARILDEAASLGIDRIVLTGGEPLDHPARIEVFELVGAARRRRTVGTLELRTSLDAPLDDALARSVLSSFDRVVVSLDGDPDAHDLRRSPGSHTRVVRNLERLSRARSALGESTRIELCGTAAGGADITALGRHLAEVTSRLGLDRYLIRPLLPLGRQSGRTLVHPTKEGLRKEALRRIDGGLRPRRSCGLGTRLTLDPDGEVTPCHALGSADCHLGNAFVAGLSSVVSGRAFHDLSSQSVDDLSRCRGCDVRYVCGAGCRAFVPEDLRLSMDGGEGECGVLYAKAAAILDLASAELM